MSMLEFYNRVRTMPISIRPIAIGILFAAFFSPLAYGEFSATNEMSAEKEKQTFLRSKNVYASLSATQMDAAKLKALSGKVLNLPARCPAVTIPDALITNQADVDHLENQLKRAQLCVIAIRENTTRPKVIELVKSQYLQATSTQIEEIADVVLLTARPLIEKHESTLTQIEEAATAAALPILRRQEIETEIADKFNLCEKEEPPTQEWKSWVAAEIFLTQYTVFDKCVARLFNAVEGMNATDLINTHYADDPADVKRYLLREIPNVKKTASKKIIDRVNATAPNRARAKAFAISDREADAEEYPE